MKNKLNAVKSFLPFQSSPLHRLSDLLELFHVALQSRSDVTKCPALQVPLDPNLLIQVSSPQRVTSGRRESRKGDPAVIENVI